MNFCHLHVHTEYSLLDGAARINRLVPRVKELGMEHLAMTDHGAMYGTVEFYKTCKQHGVHPVIGCEVYVAKNMDDKQGRVNGEFAHLILLCENNTGYQNLIYLVSQGFLRGYYYRPRIDYDLLEQHSEGLICLSACLSGDIPTLLLDGNYDGAKQLALRLQTMFGNDKFYIELMNHGIREEVQVLPQLAKLARELGIGMVATNDAHYINREDAQAQDVLMCIQTGKFLDEQDRMKLEGEELYIKSRDEMHELFSAYEGALENTVKIAERCNVDLDFETQHLPEFTAPEGYTNEQYLAELVMQGFGERYTDNDQAYQRAVTELRMISDMGFVDYFLVVWDFIRFAKENGIPVGPGRGSAAGSVVSYSLGITDIDPLKYGLMFERFLNPERITMPDIDIDFCYERRQEVIDYVIEKYGNDHVAQIITFGTMAARAVVRDVGRVMRMPYGEVDRVAKMIPFAIGMTIDKALDISKALAAEYAQNTQVHELIDTARKLEGLPRHSGTHAAGVVISKMPLVNIVPLQKNDETVTTQFSMGAIEELGLLKMDFLGLRNLTVIEEACCLVEQDTGRKPDMAALTFDDEDVYKLIASGETDGIFQMESAGMRQMLRELQPNNFEDIIASISLYRPGPMDQIPKYIFGKHHPEQVTYLHDSLRPILDVTYGCMVYQEQVMQIVRNLAGYSLTRSDLVRRAMSKKKADVMAEERRVFIHGTEDGSVPGAVRNGVPETIANQIFDQMIDFAQYAFNKSHAAAYGVVAYRTAWLKVKYPVQYMAALLNSCQGAGDKAAQYIVYCRKHGIEVLPPDVNYSGERFEVQKGKIRFGLGAVKNVGRKAIHDVISIRGAKPFDDFFDFLRRVPTGVVNKRMVESLIRSGAFDSMGHKRAQLMSVYERTMDAMAQEEKRNVQGQISLFEMTGMPETSASETLPDIDEYSPRAKLAMEKEVTGVYITGHPLLEYTDELSGAHYSAVDILQANEGSAGIDGQNVTLAGIISERHTKATKSNNLMANYVLEDLSASVNLLAFPATFEQFDPVLQPDHIVVVSGRVQVREEEEPTIIVEHAVTFQPGTGQLQNMQQGTGGAMRKAAPKKPYNNQAPAGDAPRGEDLPVYTPPAGDCTVWLRLRSFDNDFLLQGLLHTMAKHPGNVCVNAHALDKNQTVKLKQTVSPDAELLAFLSDVLGGENVKVVNR